MTTDSSDKFRYIEELINYKHTKKAEPVYIFDIDETLYPSDDTIKSYRLTELNIFCDTLGIPKEGRNELFEKYDIKYGSIIGGIVSENTLNEKNYEYLKDKTGSIKMDLNEDVELKELLTKINGLKICLTNAEKIYAARVLGKLGLKSSFDLIICCNYLQKNALCKPIKEVYTIVEKYLQCDSKNIYFFDDKKCNLEVPSKLGWKVFHVTTEKSIKDYLKEIINEANENLTNKNF